MKPNEMRALAVILIGLFGLCQFFILYNVIYTEGEVMQALYKLLLWINLPLLAVAFWKPRGAIWGSLVLAVILIPDQLNQHKRWAQLHEDVVAVVKHVQSTKAQEGKFPETLADYSYKHSWTREHIRYDWQEIIQGQGRPEKPNLRYMMHNWSISYWYNLAEPHADENWLSSGFGYYPD